MNFATTLSNRARHVLSPFLDEPAITDVCRSDSVRWLELSGSAMRDPEHANDCLGGCAQSSLRA